jgi:hypothetical protein
MPWGSADASKKTKKANTPKLRRQWAHVADEELARTGDDGKAVHIANGVIARETIAEHRSGQHEFSADEERRQRASSRNRRLRA